MGLVRQVTEHPDVQRVVKMAMALPFLPPHQFHEGHALLRTRCVGQALILAPFLDYIENYWIGVVGAGVVSVHGHPRRTNNSVEAFHKQLGRQFHAPHANVLKFCSKYFSKRKVVLSHFLMLIVKFIKRIRIQLYL